MEKSTGKGRQKLGDDINRTVRQVIKVGDNVVIDSNKGYNSFSKLKGFLGLAGEGQEWHHIVEQIQIEKSGFATELIQNPDNIISIDENIHREISKYYSRKHDWTGGLRLRDWLAGKPIEYQYKYGQEILEMFGVKIK